VVSLTSEAGEGAAEIGWADNSRDYPAGPEPDGS